MRVLITGADGFVGAPITRALLDAGAEVGALVLPGEAFRRLQPVADQVQLIPGDLTQVAELGPALADFRPEACIHLAWYAEPGKYLHSPHNIAMLHGSLDLMQLLIEVGCKQMIGAGTCAEYDTDAGWLQESGRTRPDTLYAATKLSLCITGEQLAAQAGMAFAWGRIFYPYGPQEDPRRMVPALIRSLLAREPFPASHGEQVRDYIHVQDIAQAFLTLLTQRANGVFNIGSGEPIKVRYLMETVEEIVGRRGLIQFGTLPPRDWEPPFLCADNRKLRALGWNPRFTLREGLCATVGWWQEQNRP